MWGQRGGCCVRPVLQACQGGWGALCCVHQGICGLGSQPSASMFRDIVPSCSSIVEGMGDGCTCRQTRCKSQVGRQVASSKSHATSREQQAAGSDVQQAAQRTQTVQVQGSVACSQHEDLELYVPGGPSVLQVWGRVLERGARSGGLRFCGSTRPWAATRRMGVCGYVDWMPEPPPARPPTRPNRPCSISQCTLCRFTSMVYSP